MVSSKIVMLIGAPLGGRRSYRVRSSEEENGESEMSKEVLISLIYGSGYGIPGW